MSYSVQQGTTPSDAHQQEVVWFSGATLYQLPTATRPFHSWFHGYDTPNYLSSLEQTNDMYGSYRTHTTPQTHQWRRNVVIH